MFNYSKKIPVYNHYGSVVGNIYGDTLYKAVKSSSHMLRSPKGWAWDTNILEQAKQAGVKWVRIYDRESDITYTAKLQDYFDKGIFLDRSCGPQIVLVLIYFKTDAEGEGDSHLPQTPQQPKSPSPAQMTLAL